jgi:deoxyribonuclease V
VKVKHLHSWQVTVKQAQEIQRKLASQVSRRGEVRSPHLIAGTDISAPSPEGIARGAVVILRYPELTLMETKVVEQALNLPYIPGLLSFREAPLMLAVFQKLTSTPDLILVDGQGIAHPRRFGLASHLGLLLDTPTIGCAKSRLCGVNEPVAKEIGCLAEVRDGGEVIGVALCTKKNTNPLYISIGHKICLEDAVRWVRACCRGYRLPEPTRLAHLAAGGHLEEVKTQAAYQRRLFA